MNELTFEGSAAPLGDGSFTREIRVGFAVLALFFVGLLGWAALIPLDAGATADGVVAVSGHRQAVQHRDGGIVTAIRVSEGSLVRRGEELLRISASELVASERGMTGEVLSLLALTERLRAELSGSDTIKVPNEFADLPPSDRALADEALEGQRRLFAARRAAMVTERGVLSQRIRQLNEQIGGFHAQLDANGLQQKLIQEELTGLRSLTDRGFVSINRIRSIERTAAELEGLKGARRADVARSSEAIGEAKLQIASLDRRLVEEVAGQLRDTQVQLDQLRPKLSAVREQIARSVVRAPESGRVVGLKVFTEGGVIAAGDVLMEIVPQDRALVIDSRLSPVHADDVRPGMETQVRFAALQERNIPILNGKVEKVSADGLEDERTGARFFRMEVRVPPEELARIDKVRPGGVLQAGLPVSVLVPLRKRSALTYLLEPLTDSLWLAGREN